MDNHESRRLSRRSFLRWTTFGWAAFAAAILAGATAAIRMLFPNVRQKPPTPTEFEAGRVNQIRVGTVDLRFKEHKIWLVRDPDRIYALIAECSKDACVPNWRQDDEFFECSCCGSTFSKKGLNIQGPASRALERASVHLSTDGEIVVDKSRRFLYEKGEWDSPAAFLKV